jgi:hypothetical protein
MGHAMLVQLGEQRSLQPHDGQLGDAARATPSEVSQQHCGSFGVERTCQLIRTQGTQAHAVGSLLRS